MERTLHSKEEMDAFAREWVEGLSAREAGAIVVGLSGDLGAGKTTFTQGVAHALDVSDEVTSPTFVLEKVYSLAEGAPFERLIHIDAYRLEREDASVLKLDELTADPMNLILIEWPEHLSPSPEYTATLRFSWVDETVRKVESE